uniref:Reverse transcriptase Ty1/copia-type domain-containing protein n=1 Tax=Peronospora matthiolae TaxID=2874970 RepID=A0AAV1TNK9_9STRA
MRRSSRISNPSQRSLDFDELHLSLEEACNLIEERVVPADTDSTIVCNGYVDARLAPRDDEARAFGVEPTNLQDVEQSEDRIKWKEAISEEIGSLLQNKTLVDDPLPPGRSAIKSKWAFKKKMNADGTLDK